MSDVSEQIFGSGSSGAGGSGTPLQPVGKPKVSAVSIVVAILVGLAAIAGVVVVVRLGMLPTRALIGLIVGEVILTGLAIGLLLSSSPSRHPVRFWLSAVLALALIVGNAIGVKIGMDGVRFVEDIQAPTSDTVLFDVVVLKQGPTDVGQLTGSTMGEVASDPLAKAVHDKIATMVQVQYADQTTWDAAVDALVDGTVPSIVLRDGFLQILAGARSDNESLAQKYDKLTVLTSFEVDSSLAVSPTPIVTPTPSATPTPTAATNAYVVYISGIDTDGSISNRSRSDVNMLMVVNPDTGKVLLVNTPRDYYVQLRGRSGLPDKLTHAGTYGIDVSVGTLEDLYGIPIQYYLRVNFSSLVTVVDALGGVEVTSAYDFTYGGYTFTTGTNHLDGKAALAFSRDRHDFAGGDRVRGENQQRVITGIIKKLTDPAVLSNYPAVLAAVQSSIQTSMPPDVIAAQVRQQLTTGRAWQVTSISVDGTSALDYTYSYPGQRLYVMVPDQATVDAAKDQINATLHG
ncbi:MAG: LCP family protein [Propionibacteriaceae bacterium]|jgi:LCP family protein required for cell wall assembly|nr:LCP family protein [Propionibacteriaceae bacterium]